MVRLILEDWGGLRKKKQLCWGEDLKSRITTFHPAPSFLQASACLISLHNPRPRTRVFYCLRALPWLVNPRSSGIKYEAAGPYPRSLSFGRRSVAHTWESPIHPANGSTHCGPDCSAVIGLFNLCTLSSPEKVET